MSFAFAERAVAGDLNCASFIVFLVATLIIEAHRARDLRISELLKGISGAKPPEMMPQPVVMVILPRSVSDSGDCIANSAPLDIGDRHQPSR